MSKKTLFKKVFGAVTFPFLLFMTILAVRTYAEITISKEGGTEVISIRNEAVSFKFLPTEGGICSAFEIKKPDFSFTLQPGTILFQEVFTRQAMETAGTKIPYRYRVVKDNQDQSIIEFTTTLDITNADESAAGLELKKIVTLCPGKKYLEIQQTFNNPTKDITGVSVGNRHQLSWDKTKEQILFFLPTERNVLKITGEMINDFYAKMNDWEYRPAAGWMAALNTRSETGLVFVMDYNLLDSFYTKTPTGTCGWVSEGGILKPGATRTFSCTVIPVKGFQGVVHGSKRLIADVQLKPLSGSLKIIHTLAGGIAPLGDVTIKTSVYGVRSKETVVLSPVTLPGVKVEPLTKTVLFNQPQKEPLVIRVEVAGKDWQESYESYFEGEFRSTIYPGYPYRPEYCRPVLKK